MADQDEMEVSAEQQSEIKMETEHNNEQGTPSTSTGKSKKKKKKKKKKTKKSQEKKVEDHNEEELNEGEEDETKESQVYLPGDPMEDGEELTFDSSAYKMYHVLLPFLALFDIPRSHGDWRSWTAENLPMEDPFYSRAQTGVPCLSFDILIDDLGENRTEFPMTVYVAAGTQSPHGQQNYLIVMKMSDLQEMDDDDSDNEDIIDEEPDLFMRKMKHDGPVNRVRHARITDRQLLASWSETGKVHIWDVSSQIISLDNEQCSNKVVADAKPLYSFKGHQTEGFAMDWSSTVPGRLATGDCNKNIHVWNPTEGGSWHVDQRPYSSHTQSVEDIQWSPNEATVFASCSVDQTVKVWDIRAAPSKANMITTKAHDADVNVISWNRNEPLLLSGGDDGIVKVWDLRQFKNGEPIAVFKHHTAAITSVEWLPSDNSVFAASGSDNQISLWDLAVEKDDQGEQEEKPVDVPPQLLFIHMGQKDIKELHWHAQIPGVILSTAESGFNIFKTISV